jgi:uncharacterized protein YndB with AHSA1/START domain
MAEAKNSSAMGASGAAGAAQEGASQFDLTLTRVYGAPRSVVFKAWTDPKCVAKWWGLRGFTNPVCEIDVRVGGLIRIDMRGPDGTVYPMKGVFNEIVENERIVFTATAHEDEQGIPGIENVNTITLAEQNGMTKMILYVRVLRYSPRISGALAGMEQGWSESLYRLGDVAEDLARAKSSASGAKAASSSTADREILISRNFDARRELVWDAWTDAKQVVKWWGPFGFSTTIREMDVKPGGKWNLTMHGPDGTDYPTKSVFVEVVKPERIVYTHSGGKKGGPGANFTGTWTFEEEAGKTKVTIRMIFASQEERDRIVKEDGAIEGDKQTLERLSQHLANSGKAR